MLLSIRPLWLDISDRVKSFTISFETKKIIGQRKAMRVGWGKGGVGKAFSISHETINNLSEKHDQLK